MNRIETDPNGLDQHALGAKLDTGKPVTSVLQQFGLALLEVSKVGTFGLQKYSFGGWQHVDNGIQRYDSAMMRHWLEEYTEDLDKGSGLRHAAHTAWNALAKLELLIREDHNVHITIPRTEPSKPSN